MQADQTVLSLRPGGGTRGRVFVSRFNSSTASSSDLRLLRPHGGTAASSLSSSKAKVAFSRIANFLGAPELESASVRVKSCMSDTSVSFQSANLSWDENPSRSTLRNISLGVKPGDKIAICGKVGSGKSALLAAILGEVPITAGTVIMIYVLRMMLGRKKGKKKDL